MIERYSRKELVDIWRDLNKYNLWLKIEIAAAEAMEKLNVIPKGVSKKVKSKAKIDIKRIKNQYQRRSVERDSQFDTPSVHKKDQKRLRTLLRR